MNQMGGDGGMPSMKGMEDSDDEIDSDDEGEPLFSSNKYLISFFADIPKLENSAGDAESKVAA